MPRPSSKSLRALDTLNLFLADVRDGVGPYLSVYLKATGHWNPAQIGSAVSASAIAAISRGRNVLAGMIVQRVGYSAEFLSLAAIKFPQLVTR